MPTYLGPEAGSLGSEDILEQVKDGIFSHNKDIKQCHIVLGDTLDDTEEDIKATSGVPEIASVLRGATCIKRDAKEIDTVTHPTTGVLCGLWKVECSYTSKFDEAGSQNSGGNNSDPTNQRPKRRWRTNKVTEILEADAFTGQPIQTTAGEPILIEDDVPHPVLEISRLENYPFNPSAIYNYVNHINDQAFYGAPAGSALIDDILVEEQIINNVIYEHVTYVIESRVLKFRAFNLVNIFLNDGWDIEVPNVGYLYLPRAVSPGTGEELPFVNPGTAPVTFVDASGQPQKIRLREDGSKAEPGDPDTFVTVARKIRADFTPLNLEF
jgi:hypothetical protein